MINLLFQFIGYYTRCLSIWQVEGPQGVLPQPEKEEVSEGGVQKQMCCETLAVP